MTRFRRPRVTRPVKAGAGSSLLEVLIALSLCAMIALAAVSAQTRALKLMRSALEYHRAAWLADAAAEALRSGMPREAVRREWSERAQAILPNGHFDIEMQTAQIDVLEVSWLVEHSPDRLSCLGGLACIRIAVARQAGTLPHHHGAARAGAIR
jgi:Tfp pilus assembly protein PilV